MYSRLCTPVQHHTLHSRNVISHFHRRWMIYYLCGRSPSINDHNVWVLNKAICDLWPPSSERVRAWPEVFHWISPNVRIRLASVLLSFVCEGSADSVWWTKTKETNVDTADFESASEPAWGKKVKAWVHFILVYDAEIHEFLQGHGSGLGLHINELSFWTYPNTCECLYLSLN